MLALLYHGQVKDMYLMSKEQTIQVLLHVTTGASSGVMVSK